MSDKVEIGMQFADWTVIGPSERSASGHRKWPCRCLCGEEKLVYADHLLSGASKSCSRKGHRLSKNTPGWSSWQAMLDRCRYPTHPSYHRYGGRGITVCERWTAFENFHQDMGLRPQGTTLERLDTNGNYEPGNCRWATRQEQQNNLSTNRRPGDGELTIAEMARQQGVKYPTLYSRLKRSGVI
jgi:hypothetical protein